MDSGRQRQNTTEGRQTVLQRRLDLVTRWMSVAGALFAMSIVARSVYLGVSGLARLDTAFNAAIYFGLPLCLAAGLLSALWLRPVQRARLLMICASAGIAVYSLELILQVLTPITRPRMAMSTVYQAADRARVAARLATQFGVDVDSRTPEEVLRDLRMKDASASPVLTPANNLFQRGADGVITSSARVDGLEVMPLAGLSNRTTLLCNENGSWVHYRADRHGFNNPDDVWRSSELEIAVLGDSFAHGYCVPQSQSFAGVIQRHQPKTLNLGVAGDGPLLMLATLTEYLPASRPKVVLWSYFEGNDLENLQAERRSALLSNYLVEGFRQAALRNQDALDRALLAGMPEAEAAAEDAARADVWNTATYTAFSFVKLTAVRLRLGLIRPTNREEIDAAADFETANLETFRLILQTAQQRTASWGGQLYFVYLPNWERYTARYRARGNNKRDVVLAMARELDMPVIDIDPVFRSSGDPLALFPFRLVGHYTEAGHQLVAEAIMRRLAAPEPARGTLVNSGGAGFSRTAF
ncbi:MAG TPA: SGNH/GDSL hydrolase family protein [Vicinamibacterales bacterium]|nr:SGNH/GDSL hydrolase family protein [Vicinamibacterales bacterium]